MQLSPSVYEHAAAVIGGTPWEVSRDPFLLYRAHAEAFCRYRHTPVTPGIDIYNLEPEAYGAVIEAPGERGIPTVASSCLESAEELCDLAPLDPTRDGRIPMVLGVAERLQQEYPDAVVRVPVSGPFSIATNLVDWEALFCDVSTQPVRVHEALMHLVTGQVAFAREVRRRGLDVAFFESAAAPPLLSPAQFRQIELPALQAIMDQMETIFGYRPACIIGGDTEPILDAILETGTSYVINPHETDQAAFMRRIQGHPDVFVRINASVEILAHGNWTQIREEADRLVQLGRGRPNTCLGTGVLPYETPPESVLRMAEYVREF
jgi:uroporphyrinogen-III decarboxylase